MAIIYTYPNLPLSNLSAEDLLVITNVDATNNNPTRSVTLADIATYVTGTGSGTGTTNKIVKFTDGANGLLGDSIMNEDVDKINLNGILRIADNNNNRLEVKYGTDSSTTHLNNAPASNHIIGRAGDLIIKNRARTKDILFQADDGQYDGNVSTYFRLDGSMADIGASSYYTRWGDNSHIVLGNSANTNSLDFDMYHDGSDTYLINGSSFLYVESKGGVSIENKSGGSGDIDIIQSVTNADVNISAYNGTYFKADTSAGATIFSLPVEVPLIPAANANAASKQYVDQQISNVVSGLVFQSTWDARTQAQGGLAGDAGNPDLSDASKKVVGHYYVVATAGSATPNGAGTLPNSWNVGDWCIYVEQGATDRWEKLDQTFVSGAGTAGQVTYWNSQNEVAGDNNFFWDNTNKRLGIGITTPERKLHLHQGDSTLNYIQITNDTTGQGGGDGVSFGITSNEIAIWNNREATDTSISTNNIERMVISSAGDIFISPRDTTASSGSGILYFKNVDDNSATINGGSIRTVDSTNNPSGADIRFQVANDAGTLFDAVAIDSNGFMGIGTMAPDFLLDVSGSARLNSASINSQDILVLKNGINTVNKYLGISFTTGVGGSGPHGAVRVYNGPSASDAYISLLTTSNGGTDLIQGLTQNHLGNVGIGTTSPTSKLEINANNNGTTDLNLLNLKRTWSSGTSTDRSHGILFSDNNSSMATIYADRTNSSANYNSDLLFATNTGINGSDLSTKMIIKNTGNVGIGTDDPFAKLSVKDGTDINLGIKIGQTDTTAVMLNAYNDAVTANIPMEFRASKFNFENGNVGIGTTSPSAKLEVAGDIKLSGNGTDNDSYAINFTNGACAIARDNNDLELHAFDNMVFGVSNTSYPASTERMRIDSDGKVSIQNTGGSTLNLRRDDTSIVSGDDLGSIFFQGNDPSSPFKSGAAIIGSGDGTWNMGTPNVYPSKLLFQTAKQNTLITAMRISSDQNVGIGTTTNAGAKLEIANSAEGTYLIVGGDTASNSRALAFTSSTSGVTNGALHTINAQSGNGIIAFATTSTERMRVDSSGNVLFGTTGVPNGTSIYGSAFLNTTNERMALVQATNTTSLATMQTYYNPNGAVGSIKTTGSATQFNTSSDYRLKKDLKDFDGLDKVSKIPVYDFKWKVDDSSSYGVMAHELQEVLPDAVSGEKDGEEMQGVDYSKIVPLLIKSIQELEAKVKILENK